MGLYPTQLSYSRCFRHRFYATVRPFEILMISGTRYHNIFQTNVFLLDVLLARRVLLCASLPVLFFLLILLSFVQMIVQGVARLIFSFLFFPFLSPKKLNPRVLA